jgi:transcriptional regulator with XRE-family HTH domain
MGVDAQRNPSFGELLRRYRVAAGLTQEELADNAQVSPRAISDLERGQRTRPWRDTVQLLAQALQLGSTERAELEVAARRAGPVVTSVDGGTRADLPPPRHNLPLQLTSFVGRERELAEVKERLAGTRLLTLTGAGGCGKTRLALQIGVDLVDLYPDGVWFVDLARWLTPTSYPRRSPPPSVSARSRAGPFWRLLLTTCGGEQSS